MIRADTSRTCAGCSEIRDEPWAGERETAYRCMAAGPQQGRVVGFDKAWNNLIPAWCPRRLRREYPRVDASDNAHDSRTTLLSDSARYAGPESALDEGGGRYGLPEGTPLGLQPPEIYGSRGAVHPGAAEAPKEVTRAAANVRWKQLREQLEKEVKRRGNG